MKNNQKDANNTLHWNGAFIRQTIIQEKEKSKQEEANKRPIKAKKERSLVRTERSISFPPPSFLAPLSHVWENFFLHILQLLTGFNLRCRSLKMEKKARVALQHDSFSLIGSFVPNKSYGNRCFAVADK